MLEMAYTKLELLHVKFFLQQYVDLVKQLGKWIFLASKEHNLNLKLIDGFQRNNRT